TVALVATTITFTAGNTLKAEETGDVPEATTQATEEVIVESNQENPSTETQEVVLEDQQDSKHSKNNKNGTHIHLSGASLDVSPVTIKGGTFKKQGGKLESSENVDFEQDEVAEVYDGNELIGTITITTHGKADTGGEGNYWADFSKKSETTTTTTAEVTTETTTTEEEVVEPEPEEQPEEPLPPLAISAQSYGMIYDAKDHGSEITSTVTKGTRIQYRLMDGSDAALLEQYGTDWLDEQPTIKNVGVMYVEVKATNPDCEKVATTKYWIRIQEKEVVVQASNVSKIYGDPDPENTLLAASVTGFEGDDDESLISYTITREPGEEPGGYRIQPEAEMHQGNYWIRCNPGLLRIGKGNTFTISCQNLTKEYDGTPLVPQPTTAFKGETTYEYMVGNGQWTSEVPSITEVGSIEVKIRAKNENFNNRSDVETCTLTITPKAVTVTPKAAFKVYGQDDPAKFEADVTGLVSGDKLDYTISRAKGENVGQYDLTVTGEKEQGNYTVTYGTNEFSIVPAELTVKANSTGKTYGDKDGELTATVSGLVGKDDATVVKYTLKRAEGENAGEYAITASGAALQGNYNVVYEPGTFTIAPKRITVTADDLDKVYGEDDPELTATVEGLIEGDKINYTVTRGEGEEAGTYDLEVTGETEQGNYIIEYKPGTFTIKADDNEIIVYITGHNGGEMYNGKTQKAEGYDVRISGNEDFTENDINFTGEAKVSAKNAGEYDMGLTAEDFSSTSKNFSNVTFIVKDGKLSISKRTLILISASASKMYDGKALKAEEMAVSGDGLAEGEAIVYKWNDGQTEVGERDNEFTWAFVNAKISAELNDASVQASPALEQNYEVTTEFGTLKVTEAPKVIPPQNGNGTTADTTYVTAGTANGAETTVISADKTPLANSLLDSNCCILHLLIMLAALIMLLWYARDMKRRQRKIHDLEDELENGIQ
ncbi:MAG: MBG domain-containing protein, partial [Bacillota bacterium]|nr:MBG domain-containing protein [Bacillota bacterium]